MNGEQMDLNALAAEVHAVDLATQPQPIPQPEQPGSPNEPEGVPLMSPLEEAEKLIDMVALVVGTLWPVLGYKPETKKEAAQKLAPLLEKWDVKNTILAKWGAEFEAGVFFAGVAYASYRAVIDQPQPEGEPVPWYKRLFAKK